VPPCLTPCSSSRQGHHERIAELEQEVKRLTALQQSSMYLMRRTTSTPAMPDLAILGGDSTSGGLSIPASPMVEGAEPDFENDPEFAAQASQHM
jgi:hypothetical protein